MESVKYPSGEVVWVRYLNKKGETMFILTSKPSREKYSLYELVGGVFEKRGVAKEPTELTGKYRVYERIRDV